MAISDADFGRNIKRLRLTLRMTGREFARKLEVSAESVSRWENGKALPRREHLDKMIQLAPSFKESLTAAPVLKVDPAAVPETESTFIALRTINVKVSAGERPHTLLEEEQGRWLFPAEHYRNFVRHASAEMVVLFVDGDSMLPTLTPNAPLLVLIQKGQPRVDGIWVLRRQNLVTVKRLHFSVADPARITVISDNARYPQEELTTDYEQPDFDLVGRVIAGITSY